MGIFDAYQLATDSKRIALSLDAGLFYTKVSGDINTFAEGFFDRFQLYQSPEDYKGKLTKKIDLTNKTQGLQLKALYERLTGDEETQLSTQEYHAAIEQHFQNKTGVSNEVTKQAMMRYLLQSSNGQAGTDVQDNLSLLFEVGQAFNDAIVSTPSFSENTDFMLFWTGLDKEATQLDMEEQGEKIKFNITANYLKDGVKVGSSVISLLMDKNSLELEPADPFMKSEFDLTTEKISKKEVAMLKDVFRSEIKPSLSKLQPPLLSRIKKNASGLLSAKKKPSVKQLESQADLTEERLGSSYSRMMYDAFSSSSAVPGMGVSTEYATILMDLENENQMAFYQERPHQHPKREMDSKAVENKSQVDFDVASLGSVESDVRDDVSIDSENSEESDASQSASFRMGFNK